MMSAVEGEQLTVGPLWRRLSAGPADREGSAGPVRQTGLRQLTARLRQTPGHQLLSDGNGRRGGGASVVIARGQQQQFTNAYTARRCRDLGHQVTGMAVDQGRNSS